MERIIFFEKNIPKIDLFVRNGTRGNEYKLVKQFIEFYCCNFLRNNKKNNLAVFIEPRIISGFPDIVFASYLPSIKNNWSEQRQKIDTSDLKLLSYLIYAKCTTELRIFSKLKIPEKQVLVSLEKLLEAKLIFYRNKKWYPRELRKIFSITKLVSIEAKIGDVSRVIEQSFMNIWFASHSCALINANRPKNETIDAFAKHGIGLYCKGSKFQKLLEAKEICLPSSYQSLQFNEWIGNKIFM